MGGDDDDKGPRKPRYSEPAMPLPPADDASRVTLEFSDLPLDIPLAMPDDDEDDEPIALELPSEESGEESEPEALSLVGSRPSTPALDLRAEMRERFELDDFTAALSIAELLLGRDPNDEDALGIAGESKRRLIQLYTSRLGSVASVPILDVPSGEIRWLGLDHRSGFLLSRIDGVHSIEELCDVSGMDRLEVLKTLVELRQAGAIRFE
ncbi:MAG: hypothetical protein AAF411_13710 [Myxococcota bacterium]